MLPSPDEHYQTLLADDKLSSDAGQNGAVQCLEGLFTALQNSGILLKRGASPAKGNGFVSRLFGAKKSGSVSPKKASIFMAG